jgi:hypothetical protein
VTDRIRVNVAAYGRSYTVLRSCCYTCPAEVPQGASNVDIEAYPAGGVGPIRVRLAHPSRPRLARPRPEPEIGERVLLSLMWRDLLSLFVAVVEPESRPS